IRLSKGAAAQQWDLHGLQIDKADIVNVNVEKLAQLRSWAIFYAIVRLPALSNKRQQSDRSNRLHVWHRREIAQELIKEVFHLGNIFVFGVGQCDADGEYLVGVEAGIHIEQTNKTADEQSGGDQQHQRERQFADDQRAAHFLSASSGKSSSAFTQCLLQ